MRAQDLIDAAATDRTSGSSAIVLAAAAGLSALAQESPEPQTFAPAFLEAARVLLVQQPVMGALWRLVNDCLIEADAAESHEFAADAVAATARSVAGRTKRHSSLIIHELAALAPARGVILTTSASTTLEAAFAAMGKAGRIHTVYCCEARPGGEADELAKRLRAQRVRAEAIPDAAAAVAVDRADLVVIGADAVGPGWAMNKVGSRPLATVAELAGKRAVVVADTSKLVPEPIAEVIEARVDTDPTRAAFETIPWRHLGGWLSEDGLATPVTVSSLAHEVRLHERLTVLAGELSRIR
ncbi:MAG: hypothetical protein K1X95_13260 [Acidimicrobiia bacterium]|nr:hypothetical protein [Acidimicrobiia bacterium]